MSNAIAPCGRPLRMLFVATSPTRRLKTSTPAAWARSTTASTIHRAVAAIDAGRHLYAGSAAAGRKPATAGSTGSDATGTTHAIAIADPCVPGDHVGTPTASSGTTAPRSAVRERPRDPRAAPVAPASDIRADVTIATASMARWCASDRRRGSQMSQQLGDQPRRTLGPVGPGRVDSFPRGRSQRSRASSGVAVSKSMHRPAP